MAEPEGKIPEFRKTIVTENVVRGVASGWYRDISFVRIFDEYNAFAVRKAILEYWLERSVRINEYQADWVEARIIDLKKEEGETRSGFWKELLNWYIFNATDKLSNRTLDFAISITEMNDFGDSSGYFYRSDVLKIITGKLDRSPEIYQDITTPALRLFLESFLVAAYQPNATIFDGTMVDIRRVVRCAIKAEDWHFLPMIEQVLYKLYNQKRPERYDFRQEVEILENIAFLKEAVRLLREKTE